MKWLVFILAVSPLGYCNTQVVGQYPQASNTQQAYYTQPATYQYTQTPLDYYNYYPNNYLQKQDFGTSNTFGTGNNLFGTDLFGGSGTGDANGGDALGAIGGTVGAISAAVGLKVLKKVGAATIFVIIFVIVPLLLAPLVLAIAAIIVSTTNNAGQQATDIWDKLQDKMNKRALSMFDTSFFNEECIERISCAIGRRAYERSFILRRTKNITKTEEPAVNEDENVINEDRSTGSPNVTFFTRVSRAFRSENCQAYKCSVMSLFS